MVFFVGVNGGEGDKDQKNESDEKTELDLDLAACWQLLIAFHIAYGLS